jgi:type IV fimbrial biogenesis protein FimT
MLKPRNTAATRSRYGRGVNMIELMVALAILALLLFFVAPSMGEWIANVRLRNTAQAATSGMQKARAEAIKRNQVVTFWLVSPPTANTLDNSCALSSSSASWVISLDSPAGACSGAPSDTISPRLVEAHGAGSAATGITVAALTDTTTAATQVAFDAFGQTVLPAGAIRTIDFTSPTAGTRQLRLQISLAGGVHMCDRAAVLPDPTSC